MDAVARAAILFLFPFLSIPMRIPFLGPDKKSAKKEKAAATKKGAPKTAPAKATAAAKAKAAPKEKSAPKEKTAPKEKAAHKEKAPPPPKTATPVGKTSGVGVNETWIQIFEKNEQVEEGERLTDDQISDYMKSEFPGLDAKLFDRVQIARGRYNRGGFHKKDKSGNVVRPKVHSEPHEPWKGSAATRKLHPKGPEVDLKRGPVGKYHKDYKATKK